MSKIIEKFSDFLKKNEEKIRKIASENTVKNQDGKVCISSNDEWLEEKEWEEEKNINTTPSTRNI